MRFNDNGKIDFLQWVFFFQISAIPTVKNGNDPSSFWMIEQHSVVDDSVLFCSDDFPVCSGRRPRFRFPINPRNVD